MYPDTDTPPMPIPDEWVTAVELTRPERPWEREDRYRSLGLDAPRAQRLSRAPWREIFDDLKITDPTVATTVESAFHRNGSKMRRQRPTAKTLGPWVDAIAKATLLPEGIDLALQRLLLQPKSDSSQVVESLRPLDDAGKSIQARVERAVSDLSTLRRREEAPAMRWAMGRVMPDLRGRVAAGDVVATLQPALRRALEASE
jgi:Glu-tRNA(Gln) amidotransferase subunit E-like FAD-binding protein